jgi:hypothetical protein
MHIGVVRHVEADHFGTVIGIAQYQRLRNDPVPKNGLVVIDVPEERVQRGDALFDAAFNMVPFRRVRILGTRSNGKIRSIASRSE